MQRVTSFIARNRWAAKLFGVFAILIVALASCAQGDESDPAHVSLSGPSDGGSAIATGTGGGDGGAGACNEGDKRACHVTLGQHEGVLSCFVGLQFCTDGAWGECGDGSNVTKVPAKDDGKPLSLTEQKVCDDNPCDPRCKKWVEDGKWKADGSVCKWVWSWSAAPAANIAKANKAGAASTPCTFGSDCQQNQLCQDPAQGACSHDICTKGAGLVKGCETQCVDEICALKPQCCEKKYDGTCETEPCLTYEKGLTKDCDPKVTKTCDWDKTCCPYKKWEVCSYWDIVGYQTVCEWVDTYVCGWRWGYVYTYFCGWRWIETYLCGWHWTYVYTYLCGWRWIEIYLCGWHWRYVYTYLCGWRYIYTYFCGWRWRYVYTYICGWRYIYTYICGWRWRYIYTYICGWRYIYTYLCGWRWRYVYTYICGWRWIETYICGWRWTYIQTYVCGWRWIQNYVCGWTWQLTYYCDWWSCWWQQEYVYTCWWEQQYVYDCWWEQQYVYTYECWWEQQYVYQCWWEDVYTYLYECWWEYVYTYGCWWEDVYTYLYECWWEDVYTYGCWWEDVYTYLYECWWEYVYTYGCWWEDVYTYLYECWWEQQYVYDCWWEYVYTYLYECWWDQRYVYECWWEDVYTYVYECWWELTQVCWEEAIYGWIYYDCEKSYDGLWDQHCVDQYKVYAPGTCPMSWKGDWDATCINAVHDTCHDYCDGVNKGAGACVEWEAPNYDSKCDTYELGVGLTCKGVNPVIPICNTGAKEAPKGIAIAILPKASGYFGGDHATLKGAKYCYTDVAIPAGECRNVTTCDVTDGQEVVVNPKANANYLKSECFDGDNWGFYYADTCGYPPKCPGGYLDTTKTENYENTCDAGLTPQWGYLSWDATTPTGSEVSFRVRAADAKADLVNASWYTVTTKSTNAKPDCSASGPSPCPIDIFALVGKQLAQKKFLDLEVTFKVSADQKSTPTLESWQLSYTCIEEQ